MVGVVPCGGQNHWPQFLTPVCSHMLGMALSWGDYMFPVLDFGLGQWGGVKGTVFWSESRPQEAL